MTTECSYFRVLAIMVAGAILAGCGGGDSPATSAVAPNPTTPGVGTAAPSPSPTPSPSNPVSVTGSATIAWTAPVENHDGSAISDLAGYRIYHGTSADALNGVIQVSSPGISVYVIDNLPLGKHYFAVTAYNSMGAESDRSEVASKTIK